MLSAYNYVMSYLDEPQHIVCQLFDATICCMFCLVSMAWPMLYGIVELAARAGCGRREP